MTMFRKHTHLFTGSLLLMALGCYAMGLATGAALLFGAGVLLEAWFWVRLVRAADAGQQRSGSPAP